MKRPVFFCTLAFIFGILLTDFIAIFAPICLFLFCLFLILKLMTRREVWLRFALFPLLFIAGSWNVVLHQFCAADDVSHLPLHYFRLTGVVQSDPNLHLQGDNFATFTLEMLNVEGKTLSGEIFVVLAGKSRKTKQEKENIDTSVSYFPQYGDVIFLQGKLEIPKEASNPGNESFRESLEKRGIRRTLKTRNREDWHPLSDESSGVSGWVGAALKTRHALLNSLRTHFSPVHAAVLGGILLGAQGDLSPQLAEEFKITGTSHLLSTAGLHIGILVAMLFWALPKLGVPRRHACLLILIFLAFFVFVAGGRPAVVRACLMSGLVIGGYLLEREPNWLNMISISALILLLMRPAQLYEFGFQVTFATVITLVALSPFLMKPLHLLERKAAKETGVKRLGLRLVLYVAGCFLLSVGAQIGAFGSIVVRENQVSLLSPFANAMLVPLIPLFYLLSLLFLLTLLIAPLNFVFVATLKGSLSILIAVVQWWANTGVGTLIFPILPGWFSFLYYGILWGALFTLADFTKLQNEQEKTLIERAEA